MKKLLAILISLCLVMGCAAALADGIKLGIVTPDADHGFTGESVAHARAEAEAMKAAGIIEDYMMAVGAEASKQISEGAKIVRELTDNADCLDAWKFVLECHERGIGPFKTNKHRRNAQAAISRLQAK